MFYRDSKFLAMQLAGEYQISNLILLMIS